MFWDPSILAMCLMARELSGHLFYHKNSPTCNNVHLFSLLDAVKQSMTQSTGRVDRQIGYCSKFILPLTLRHASHHSTLLSSIPPFFRFPTLSFPRISTPNRIEIANEFLITCVLHMFRSSPRFISSVFLRQVRKVERQQPRENLKSRHSMH